MPRLLSSESIFRQQIETSPVQWWHLWLNGHLSVPDDEGYSIFPVFRLQPNRHMQLGKSQFATPGQGVRKTISAKARRKLRGRLQKLAFKLMCQPRRLTRPSLLKMMPNVLAVATLHGRKNKLTLRKASNRSCLAFPLRLLSVYNKSGKNKTLVATVTFLPKCRCLFAQIGGKD